MGAIDTARGALGGPALNLGAIGKGAIPRPGGGPAFSGLFRFNTLADLTAFGTHLEGSQGRWDVDAGGSTGSGVTGPGTNSSGPYVYTETSSSASGTIRERSRVDLIVVDMWPEPTDRVLRLRISAQGEFTEAGEGLEVQSRVDDTDTFDVQKLIRGWAYSDGHSLGGTIRDAGGVDHVCSQTGGWIDVDIAIPDGDMQVRFEEVWTTGTNWLHDIALWHAELRNA